MVEDEGTQTTQEPLSPRDKLWALGGVLLTVFVLVGIWSVMAPQRCPPEAQSCGDLRGAGAETKNFETPEGDPPQRLVVREGHLINFATSFRDTAPYEEETEYCWSDSSGQCLHGGGQPKGIEIGDRLAMDSTPSALTTEDGRKIPLSQFGFVAVAKEGGIEIWLCVDPAGVKPGKYSSVLTFDDPDITAPPIAVEMTAWHNDMRTPLTSFILGGLVAYEVALVKAYQARRKPTVAIVVAVAVAILLAFMDLGPMEPEANNPTWGASEKDFVFLFVAAALAILGSSTVGEFLDEHGRKKMEGQRGADTRVTSTETSEPEQSTYPEMSDPTRKPEPHETTN